jgi:LysR family hydrogen peroxide-inducible transcriptional activator
MNLQQLEYALAVAATGHFGQAAELCHVTQPTLSTMLAKLEDELGIVIFERGKPPARPTPHGQEVLQRAQAILLAVKNLREFAAQLTGPVAGPLRLGVIPTLAPYLAPPLLQTLLLHYPDLDLTVEETVTRDVEDRLLAHSLDVALVATPPIQPGITAQAVGTEPFVLYHNLPPALFNPAHFAQVGSPLVESLPMERLWLLQDVHCFRGQVLDYCAAKGVAAPPRLRYEAGSIATLVPLVDQLQGFTFLPALAVPSLSPAQRARVVALGAQAPFRTVYVAHAATFPRRQVVQAIQTAVGAHLQASLNS